VALLIFMATIPPTTHNQMRLQVTMALLIPAHNEELAIEHTIRTAIAAGQPAADIFIVDDNSNDTTSALAIALLGQANVVRVRRSGKALAINKAIKRLRLGRRYEWIHVADADGIFSPTYFTELRKHLDADKYVAATGHIQSLRGNWISKYRLFEYTLGLEIYRRIQAWFGVITVIPGATSCFRSDVFNQLEFSSRSLTEDFDLTMQIYRKKLGKIQYIPQAKCYTQDPQNFHDYVVQIKRWYRGFFQGVREHRVGLRPHKIDLYIAFTLLQSAFYTAELLFLPLLMRGHTSYLSIFFLADVLFFFGYVIVAAAFNKRWDIVSAFPLFYILRFTNMAIFATSFFEIMILNRFKQSKPIWDTEGRRYQIASASN
jgi:biofilm PGA synthesis N-glycosyltransferase PgaC